MADNVNTSLEGKTPEEGGAATERTFTQDDVNRIVQERLAKERSKTSNTSLDERERELTARENKIKCSESLTEKGYPKELLDILDTSDTKKFNAALEKLESIGAIRGTNSKPIPKVVSSTPGMIRDNEDGALRDAFGLK